MCRGVIQAVERQNRTGVGNFEFLHAFFRGVSTNGVQFNFRTLRHARAVNNVLPTIFPLVGRLLLNTGQRNHVRRPQVDHNVRISVVRLLTRTLRVPFNIFGHTTNFFLDLTGFFGSLLRVVLFMLLS